MQLSSRQRLLRLFGGQDIDRIPIWLLAPYHRLHYYADLYNLAAYTPVTQAIAQFADTFDRRRPELGFCYNCNPRIQRLPIADSNRTGTAYQFERLRFEKYTEKRDGHTDSRFFVTDPSQLADVLSIPFVPHTPDFGALEREKIELGERGLLMMDLGDPLEPLYHLCSAEDFSMWTLTDLDVLLDFTDQMNQRVLSLYKRYLDLNIADAYFIVGAEFAGPPLVSPKHFNELSQRYLTGLIQLIREYGKISIVHYHGNLAQVLDGFKIVNPDGLHTIEAPPVGNCTISQARLALGKDMTLIGNIQYDDLERRSPQEIREMVRDAIAQGKGGRFILSPTAGPYDPDPSPKLIDNYLAMIHAGIEYGRL